MIKTNQLSVRFLSVVLVATGLGVVGCAAEPADEEVGQVASALMPATAPYPVGTDSTYAAPACPATETSAKSLHGKATAAFKYVLGGSTSLPAWVSGTTTQRAYAKQCLDDLRALVGSQQCTVSTLSANTLVYDTNCGFRGVARRMTCDGSFTSGDAKACRDNLDASWGKGVGAFFLPFKSSTTANTYWLDPEPVRLTADLSSMSGATAAGVYLNSLASTSVLNWPQGWTASRYPPSIGAPCSTNALATDSEALLTIFASGTYRACK